MDQTIRNVFIFVYILSVCDSKYLEGELKTTEDWAFLARFCFLSESGTFEFYFEFMNDQGYPNLLLYYDAIDQWPSVYKSNKNCRQKESVLHIGQNQIVNLTLPDKTKPSSGGCTYHILGDTKEYTRPKTTQTPPKAVTFYVNLSDRTKGPPITTQPTPKVQNYTNNPDDVNENTTGLYDVENFFGEEFLEEENATEGPRFIEKRSVYQPIPDQLGKALITCRNARRFKSSRARWWFLALSNCNGHKGIHIKYQILMTNGRPGDYWHEHFSADEFYVLPVLMAFSIAYGMLIFSIIICSVELKSRQLLHTTYKLYVLSVVLQLTGIALTSMAYLKYAVSGTLPYRTKILGAVFMGASETIFLLLLLLLAKGYTTTRGRLPLPASVKITIFMCIYAVTYITLFIYEAKVFDPGEVLYLYESPAGYGLIVLRILAWWMFIYSTIFTLKHYPEKSNFYYPFNICGTLWFVAGPAFILSANSYVDKWVRESVVCGVLLFITFAGHLMFLILTLPSMANKNFPFHIRTTQIGVMQVTGGAGASTIDQFSHHVYQPTTTIEQTVIIPLNPYTDDIFSGTQRPRPQIQQIRDSDPEESDVEDNGAQPNQKIDNVLKWSTVKGYVSPLEIDNRRGSSRSHVTEFAASPRGASPGAIFRAKNLRTEENNLTEWTRDVPVELFTISKMIINKPNT